MTRRHSRGECLCRGKCRCVGRRERQRVGWREGGRGTRCVGWIEAHRSRVAATQRFARIAVLVIDLDVLHFGELFEIQRQRARDRVERTVRLAFACEVDMHHTIGKGHFAVAGETVEDKGQSLVAFHVAWTFEKFIQHGTD